MDQKVKEFMSYLKETKSKSTVDNVLSHTKAFLRAKNVTDLSKITKELVSGYFAEMQPKCTVEKFNMVIWSLRTFFGYCKIEGLEYPRQKQLVKKAKEAISEHELLKMIVPKLDYLFKDSWKVRAILYFLFYTGLRPNEFMFIRRKNFMLDKNELMFTDPQGRFIRRVPLPGILVEELKRYFEFTGEEENVFDINVRDINRICRTLQRNEVLGKDRAIKPNFFKNSFARLCLEKGVDIFILSQLMNHRNVKTTFNNLQMMSDEIKNMTLNKFKDSKPTETKRRRRHGN
jgi:integrase